MLALIEACQEEGLLANWAEICLVFSDKEDAPGLRLAQEQRIETLALPKKAGEKRADYDKRLIQLLKTYSFDYILLAGYMRILSKAFVQAYPKKILNIHPADTRQHQGLEGYKWAWEQGLAETAITVHLVDEGLDTGPILAQESLSLQGLESLEALEARGLAIEHKLYAQTLLALAKERALEV